MKAEQMDPRVGEKFKTYPPKARRQLSQIRSLIYKLASDLEVGEIQESLKWGEPSYTSKIGSPIRMDWKEKNPDRVSVFFNCNTRLVDTFREIYRDELDFIGNREIALPISSTLPKNELSECISMALQYQKIKKLPLLGA